ncbi:unnamed protein product [Polarella glacialis]|uniref:Uncharacterized protein n=1 Tax=Polarella glacialis TaxID=89957 RepID=A0A813JXA9_POLGL|nr:unnamed protein product [Polarella glacialis]
MRLRSSSDTAAPGSLPAAPWPLAARRLHFGSVPAALWQRRGCIPQLYSGRVTAAFRQRRGCTRTASRMHTGIVTGIVTAESDPLAPHVGACPASKLEALQTL